MDAVSMDGERVREGERANIGQSVTICGGSSGRRLPEVLISYLIKSRPGRLRPPNCQHVVTPCPATTCFPFLTWSTSFPASTGSSFLEIVAI